MSHYYIWHILYTLVLYAANLQLPSAPATQNYFARFHILPPSCMEQKHLRFIIDEVECAGTAAP